MSVTTPGTPAGFVNARSDITLATSGGSLGVTSTATGPLGVTVASTFTAPCCSPYFFHATASPARTAAPSASFPPLFMSPPYHDGGSAGTSQSTESENAGSDQHDNRAERLERALAGGRIRIGEP